MLYLTMLEHGSEGTRVSAQAHCGSGRGWARRAALGAAPPLPPPWPEEATAMDCWRGSGCTVVWGSAMTRSTVRYRIPCVLKLSQHIIIIPCRACVACAWRGGRVAATRGSGAGAIAANPRPNRARRIDVPLVSAPWQRRESATWQHPAARQLECTAAASAAGDVKAAAGAPASLSASGSLPFFQLSNPSRLISGRQGAGEGQGRPWSAGGSF